jgi:tetratricopeptide (TPR) repeat protein
VRERQPEPFGQLLAGERALGSHTAARQRVAVRGDVLVERHLIIAVAAPPEAVPVTRLIDRDPVDPCAQARVPAEAMDRPEDAQEDFLRKVERLVAIAQQVHGELDHHALVLAHEVGAGQLVAGNAPPDERGVVSFDLRPGGSSSVLHSQLRKSCVRIGNSFHYIGLRPRLETEVPGYHTRDPMRRPTAAILLILLATGTVAAYQVAREHDYRSLLARGEAALEADQTFGAIEAFSGAIALRPASMLAHLRRGETYERRGELEEAARDFRRAADLDPTAPRPLDELGDALYRLDRFARAADAYEAYLALDDRAARVDYKLALARYESGDTSAAILALSRTVALDGQFTDAYYLLGVCLRDANRPKEAVDPLDRAVALSPGLVPAREELADLYGLLGRQSDQLDELEVLAGLDRTHVERQVAVALAHARAGHVGLAVVTLSNALERSAGQPLVYEALGRVWLDIARARGDQAALGKAIEALARVAADPNASSDALLLYGQALLRDDRQAEAERVLQQAVTREPVAAPALREYADVSERAGHLEEARNALIEYRALTTTGDAHELARIGLLSAELHDPAGAARWFARAVDLAPHDTRILAGLAAADLALGRMDRARAVVLQGLDVQPDDARLLDLLRRLGGDAPAEPTPTPPPAG